MFSKEESRRLKKEFWTSFGKSFPRKWILYQTGIKDFSFKFYFDKKSAHISLDIEGDLDHRVLYFGKMQGLETILKTEYLPEAKFEDMYMLDNGKEISRIYITLNEKVSIHNKNTWRVTMEFFNEKMHLFELFFLEYKDVIKAN
jgi:hypothetical protein